MKKWIVVACSLVVLFLVAVNFLIPDEIVVARSVITNGNQAGMLRFLNDDRNWKKCWPDSSMVNTDSGMVLEWGGYRFKKTKTMYDSFEVSIEEQGNSQSSLLYFLSLGIDSTKIAWSTSIATSKNPFNKIKHYFKAKELDKKLGTILASMQEYVSQVKNIYGLDIRKEKIPIDYMVSVKKEFDHHPTTEDIYKEMRQIRQYIAQEKATEINYHVLNISSKDSSHFELVVGIAVEGPVRNSGDFSERRMLKNGNVVITEVTGGVKTVEAALKQMEAYISDHKELKVTISFQSFLTDRLAITDTTKWRTRIGFPIL